LPGTALAGKREREATLRGKAAHRAVLATTLLLLAAAGLHGQQKISSGERLLFDSVNRERAARQLRLLKWDEGLARAARKHAELMAKEDQLVHQLPGELNLATRAREAGASFSHITENIGMAVDDHELHDGWMHSPGHRANILDAGIDSVGIAIFDNGDYLYAVEDFALAVEALSIEEQEKRVGTLVTERGLHLIKIGDDARKSCELEKDYTGKSKPRFISHFETPDISRLPEELEKEIQSGRYKSAAIGACPPKQSAGFTTFRIVVLLY
jgi:hypothetical protein